MNTTAPQAYWSTTRRTAGHICKEHAPQIPGASEGYAGPYRELLLCTDASDGTWAIVSGKARVVCRGTAADQVPTPLQALQMARPATAKRLMLAD